MKAYLIINLGTPEKLSVGAVRRYLREFLMDKYVIDINPILRFLLVYCIISVFRGPKSFEAYAKIWTHEGSPLLCHSNNLVKALKGKLSEPVYFAMRYASPSISSTLKQMKQDGVTEICLLPLYPQYAESSTLSSIKKVQQEIKKLNWSVELKGISHFFNKKPFIHAWSEKIKGELKLKSYDHILFTYHGLPQHHLTKLDVSNSHCHQKADCCACISQANALCYRAQCFETTRQIAAVLNLNEGFYTTAFQSRLGRREWIRPYTDLVIPELAKKGVGNLLVISPSFVADCLETIEEMGLRGHESFLANGGRYFHLLSSLNDDDVWVDALTEILSSSHYENLSL